LTILPSYRRWPIETQIIGGRELIALKYENGARFVTPFAPFVEMNAIGRGTTAEIRIEYTSLVAVSLGSICTAPPPG
jgi:hypothetical protein